MSASASSDSWILIALTIFVVLLLFYLSKKMICNSYYGGEQGPASQSSSSSSSPYAYASESASNSNSTSFSDYYCGGSSPFDPGEVSSALSSSDDFHNADRIRRENPLDIGTESRRTMTENGCGCNNNNNEDNINNFGLRRDIVTTLNVGREEGSTTLPSFPTTGQRFYREMRPSTISIISSEDMNRKTMLEGQLRNQITKIVQAEREIQRLVQLLATEQGMDSRQYLRAAARASLRPDMRHLYSDQNHGGIFSTSSNSSGMFERSTTSSSEATTAEATVQSDSPTSTTTRQVSMLPFKHNDMIPSLSHSTEISPATTPPRPPLPLNDDDEGDEDDDHGPPSSHLHQNDAARGSIWNQPNEWLLPSLSDSLLASQNTNQVCTSPPLSSSTTSGMDPRSLFISREYGHHHHNHCRCNLCYTMSMSSSSSGRIRRMLLLRQMLLPISSSFQVESEARYTGGTRSDRLSTPFPPLTSCLHYPHEYEQPVSSRSAYLHHSPISEDDRDVDNDDLPTYEECIRSTSTYNNNNIDQVHNDSNLTFINSPTKV